MGSLKQRIKKNSQEVSVNTGDKVIDLLKKISLTGSFQPIVMIRNSQVENSKTLVEGDVLYLFEPIQGG
tara:strand:+ start:354 stop:560 length:207 start_codon:yes stop_codon:yes gene_type:complete